MCSHVAEPMPRAVCEQRLTACGVFPPLRVFAEALAPSSGPCPFFPEKVLKVGFRTSLGQS